MVKAIILAAGSQDRWQESGGAGSKHLIEIGGEPLLARIVRQLRAEGVTDILISGPYHVPGCESFVPPDDDYQTIADGRIAVATRWNQEGRTIILLGDTFYTDAAMRTIVQHTGSEPHLFARFGPSPWNGKPWGEPFANSFLPEHQVAHATALIQGGGLWEAYQIEHGMSGLETRGINLGDATEIDDATEDFDFAVDLERWLALRQTSVH